MANLGKDHWHALKWIMRYISGSLDMGLVYGNVHESKEAVSGYVDTDFVRCIDLKRSLSGYIFTIYGGVVSWKKIGCFVYNSSWINLSCRRFQGSIVVEGFN